MSPPSVAASVLEEDLRESASIGDADRLTKLLNSGVDINSRHSLNGWTALHWAAHRGYPTICRLLLQRGADPNVKNLKGDTPGKLTERPEILQMLGEPETRDPSHVTSPASTSSSSHQPAFVPNYLRHPSFPHARPPASNAAPKLASPSSDETTANAGANVTTNSGAVEMHAGAISCLSLESGVNADCSTVTTPSQGHNNGAHRPNQPTSLPTNHSSGGHHANNSHSHHHHHLRLSSSLMSPPLSHQHLPYPGYNPDELVVKVRIEGHPDPDFIEVELPRGPGLDFELLLDILSEELGVPKNLISKVRKRPDTILRKDRDLMRLRDFEELEIVVSQTPCVNSPANGGRYVPKYGGVQARILY